MDSETPSQFPTSGLTRGMFIVIMICFIILITGHEIKKDINPVFKGPRTYKFKIADTGTIPRKIQSNKPSKREHIFQPIILAAAHRYSVDPALVKAVIMAESGYNPVAVSKKGAIGLMQLMPATAVELGVEDSFDPENNINGGVKYLKQLMKRFRGNLPLAIAAYNAGSTNVRKHNGIPPYKATRYYVKKVFEYYEFYKDNMKQKSNRI